MANREALHRHYYGEMKLPRSIEIVRHGYGPKRVNWTFFFTFNWWSLRIIFWHRWLGGIQAAYQHPSWVLGWAKYGILNQIQIFKPKSFLTQGGAIPRLFNWERWSDVVTDKELCG